VLPLLT